VPHARVRKGEVRQRRLVRRAGHVHVSRRMERPRLQQARVHARLPAQGPGALVRAAVLRPAGHTAEVVGAVRAVRPQGVVQHHQRVRLQAARAGADCRRDGHEPQDHGLPRVGVADARLVLPNRAAGQLADELPAGRRRRHDQPVPAQQLEDAVPRAGAARRRRGSVVRAVGGGAVGSPGRHGALHECHAGRVRVRQQRQLHGARTVQVCPRLGGVRLPVRFATVPAGRASRQPQLRYVRVRVACVCAYVCACVLRLTGRPCAIKGGTRRSSPPSTP
jgi:hypothetical protein